MIVIGSKMSVEANPEQYGSEIHHRLKKITKHQVKHKDITMMQKIPHLNKEKIKLKNGFCCFKNKL